MIAGKQVLCWVACSRFAEKDPGVLIRARAMANSAVAEVLAKAKERKAQVAERQDFKR